MPWSVWVLTLVGLTALIALDFVTISRKRHDVVFREALALTVFYTVIAILFGIGLYLWATPEQGSEFFAAYLVERSLSVDNLFVFIVILSAFAVPSDLHHRVLLFGVVLALALRGIFIAVGAAAVAAFSFTFVLFGALLIWTGVQLFRHRDEDPDPMDNVVMRTITKRFPVGGDYATGRLLARTDGRLGPTPFLIVLIAIGFTDVLFAIDSIPASFGVTQNAYLVFTANVFALLGLRALYFVLEGALGALVHLGYGLAAILAFIGAKLVMHWAHGVWSWVPEIDTLFSLGVIVAILAIVVTTSLISNRRRAAHLDVTTTDPR